MLCSRLSMGLAAAILAMSHIACIAHGETVRQRGYFVSVDGLSPDLLETLAESAALKSERGFRWLLRDSLYSGQARSVVTTLTAPSHISTITCTPPSRHGVVANAFLQGGLKVSGFTAPFATEPLWQAAARQGRKTLSLAYVGADGLSPERTADYGLAYPNDAWMGRSRNLTWEPESWPEARGWTLPAELKSTGRDLRESSFALSLSPKSSESRTVHVLYDGRGDEAAWLYFDADKDLSNGHFGALQVGSAAIVDVFFTETDARSPTVGYKRRAFVRLLPGSEKSGEAGKIEAYVSKASYNNAYPESFRQKLDELNLVWPDYGVRSDRLSMAEALEAQAMIDRFLTEVAVRFVPELNVDVVLLYQPLIDSVGHQLQAALPRPFNPEAPDEVTRAFVRAFQIVDENLSRVFADVTDQDVIALMGDHGMDPSLKVVNIAPLLPRDHSGRVEVITSGSLAMLYPAGKDDVAVTTEAGRVLKESLARVTYAGKAAFGEAHQREFREGRRATSAPFADEWHYGEAQWAFTAGSGFWFLYNPLSPEILLEPTALGMHGQASTEPTMATAMIFKGKGVRQQRLGETRLLDAVPTFMALMGMKAPADCLGTSLLERR